MSLLRFATRCNRAAAGDFLLGKVYVEVDRKLLKRVIEIQQMNTEDREHILYTLDALIKSVKLKSIA